MLKPGTVVEIYTDYKNSKGYEGKAIILEYISSGDSYYKPNEKIFPDENFNKELLDKFINLTKFLSKKEGLMVKFIAAMNRCSTPDKMKSVIDRYKNKSSEILNNMFSKNEDDYIIEYFLQSKPNWQPTIMIPHKYKVKFIEDNTGWSTNFVTNRYIPTKSKYNKNKTYILKSTTYSSKHLHRNHIDEDNVIPSQYSTLSDKSLNNFFNGPD